MYSKYERPIIKCSIFYYDIEYDKRISKLVLDILEKYNMFPPEMFYADKLTKNRFVFADKKTKDLLIQSYAEKDVLEIDMSSGDSRKVEDYWRVNWNYTFYKNSKLAVEPQFMPWNILSIQSTHGRLKDPSIYNDFMNCVKELIEVIEPFYASLDDVDNKVKLMDKMHEKRFVPDYIQGIYWGNYFGEEHCNNWSMEKIMNIPAKNIEKIKNGVFFTLTDHALEYDTKECNKIRKTVKQYLEL